MFSAFYGVLRIGTQFLKLVEEEASYSLSYPSKLTTWNSYHLTELYTKHLTPHSPLSSAPGNYNSICYLCLSTLCKCVQKRMRLLSTGCFHLADFTRYSLSMLRQMLNISCFFLQIECCRVRLCHIDLTINFVCGFDWLFPPLIFCRQCQKTCVLALSHCYDKVLVKSNFKKGLFWLVAWKYS